VSPLISRFFSPLLIAGFLIGCASESADTLETEEVLSNEILEEVLSPKYGIDPANYTLTEGKIKRNQFLADILLPFNVSYAKIAELEAVAKDVFDVRKLRAGYDYTIYTTQDSTSRAEYFVVETGRADYVVYGLGDSVTATKGSKPIEYKLRSAGGVINSSLYLTITENDLSTELAMKLNDIYAWTVDFYRIERGDYFKVLFEEIFVEGEPIGIGKIYAAEFNHRGESFFSYRFEDGELLDYFDNEGESLRKAFLKAPLNFSRISSRYSLKRYHPVQKRWKAHLGTDYAAPTGTPIMTTGDGTVIASAYGKYNGNYVKIRHNSTYTTQYLHMSKRAVKKGDFVRQGDVIGYVGSTGLATGPHVCYRFWKNGEQVDPYRQELPASEPLPEEYKEEFFVLRDSLSGVLQEVRIPELNS
jgi:murein DD-endopeptidase MepM/ murein hydrolase activator NlpD